MESTNRQSSDSLASLARDENRKSRIRHRAPLCWVLAAASCGIVGDRFAAIPIALWIAFAFATVTAWQLIRFHRFTEALFRGLPAGSILTLLLVAVSFGAWHHACFHTINRYHVCRFASNDSVPVCLEGQIVSPPRTRYYPDPTTGRRPNENVVTEFSFRALRIRDGGKWRLVTGIVQVRLAGEASEIPCGVTAQLFGYLRLPPRASNPSEFDRREFLREKGVYAQLFVPQSGCVIEQHFSDGYQVAHRSALAREHAQRRVHSALTRHFSNRTGSFAIATLLGDQSQLREATRESFRRTGTSHLLAISGLHLGILCGPLFVLVRIGWLSRSITLPIAILFVWSYCWLVEFRPPIVRASVLVTVIAAGKLSGREISGWNSLALAALVLLCLNPTHLFATGAQLSFLAVATLMQLHETRLAASSHDSIHRLIDSSRSTPERILRRSLHSVLVLLRMCLWLWIISAPLVAARFHFTAPIGILVNPFVLLPMTIALFSAAVVVVADLFLPAIAPIVALPGECSMQWVLSIVDSSSKVQFGGFATMGPSSWWVIGFYLGMLVIGCDMRFEIRRRWKAALLLAWCAVGTVPDSCSSIGRIIEQRSSVVDLTFVDVGHGSSVICQLADGRVLLYDAGSMAGPLSSGRAIASVLWHERISHIDAIVISHCDADHYNGIPFLLEQFTVGAVYVEPSMRGSSDPDWNTVLDQLGQHGISAIPLAAPSRLKNDSSKDSPLGVEINVIHPVDNLDASSDNERSVALRISAFDSSVLLPGDLENRTLRDVLKKHREPCQVLMAPHHGSGTIPIVDVLEAWNPETVVISGSRTDKTPSVRRRYAREGAKVYHTQSDGAVKIEIGPNRFLIDTFLEPQP